MITRLLLFAAAIGTVHADETADAIRELSETYAKQDGYIATYHSEGHNKILTVVLGSDRKSGLGVIRSVAEKEGRKMDVRQWNTEDDRFFIDSGQARTQVSGIEKEITALVDAIGADPEIPRFTPSFWLEERMIHQGAGFSNGEKPPWLPALEGSKLKETTGETFTFDTQTGGSFSISRKHGLMTGQTFANDPERVLTLGKVQLDPGAERVKAISKDWPVDGFNEAPRSGLTLPIRKGMLEMLIQSVEKGALTPEDLKKRLGSRTGKFREFAALALPEEWAAETAAEIGESLELDREAIRKKWEAAPDKGNDFEAFLAAPATRRKIISGNAVLLAGKPAMKATMKQVVLGLSEGKDLASTTDAGEKARDFIYAALTLAVAEVFLEKELDRQWGKPAGAE